jgi:hypothetical protein
MGLSMENFSLGGVLHTPNISMVLWIVPYLLESQIDLFIPPLHMFCVRGIFLPLFIPPLVCYRKGLIGILSCDDLIYPASYLSNL